MIYVIFQWCLSSYLGQQKNVYYYTLAFILVYLYTLAKAQQPNAEINYAVKLFYKNNASFCNVV